MLTDDEVNNALEEANKIVDFFKTAPTCNNCGEKPFCKIIPDVGEMVRINCPYWQKNEWYKKTSILSPKEEPNE